MRAARGCAAERQKRRLAQKARPRSLVNCRALGLVVALSVGLCSVPASALATISVGSGAAGVKLGDQQTRVRSVLGAPAAVRPPTWRYGGSLAGTVGFDHVRRVNFVSTTSRRQRTSRHIGPGASLRDTRRAYPTARCRAQGRRRLCVVSSRYRGRKVETEFAFAGALYRVDIYFVDGTVRPNGK